MEVYWLELTEEHVPTEDDWLSAAEAAHLATLRFPKRRGDWRLGRWTAKCALAAWLKHPGDASALINLEIRPAPSGAPEVFIHDELQPLTISLTHRAGTAVCALTPSRAAMGCDLELIEPHSQAFLADYFTPAEQALVAQASDDDRLWLPALLWSAKESALKALRVGLREDTRSLSVTLLDDVPGHPEQSGWRQLVVTQTAGQVFQGWWQKSDTLVKTMVAASAPFAPISLRTSMNRARDIQLA